MWQTDAPMACPGPGAPGRCGQASDQAQTVLGRPRPAEACRSVRTRPGMPARVRLRLPRSGAARVSAVVSSASASVAVNSGPVTAG